VAANRNVRVAVTKLEAGERELVARAARYVARVRRVSIGERFVVFDPEAGVEADAELVAVRAGRAVCRVGAVRPARRSPFSITLIQAIGKGDKVDRVVRDATALGVGRVVVVDSGRSVPRLGERAPARRDRWRAIAVEVARQSGRGDLPEIEGPKPLGEALGEGAGDALRVVLVPGAAPLASVLADRCGARVVLLVGPEGGFDDAELAATQAAGFVAAALGPFVLRTETAATAALGAVTAHLLKAEKVKVES
jgi:16S rRNA (uracil1498-N3)-methyltransferase